jgi:hypothetical protein
MTLSQMNLIQIKENGDDLLNILRPVKKPGRIRNWTSFLIFWFLLVSPPFALSDYISMSGAENAPNIAEIHINNDHVKIVFEIYIKDLATFYHLLPDEFYKEINLEALPLKKRMETFSRTGLQVITDTGQRLVPDLVIGEPRTRVNRASPFAGKINPMTRQRIPGPPEDKRVFYAELIYPFTEKPTSLTFIPPLDEKTGSIAASIGFATFHKQAIISYFNYLSGASTILLDWEDHWYSQYKNKVLKRKMTGGVRSFIYIEPFEIRHEILARVKDVEAWMDLKLEGKEFIEVHENEALKKRVGQFFLEQENLLIDGKQFRPILDRTAFVKYTMTGSRFLEQPERLPLASARIGVIVTYLTKGIPQKVETRWNLWSDRIIKIPTNAIDPAGPFPSYITPDDNVHVWENFLKTYKIPTIEKVLVSDIHYRFKFSAGSIACMVLVLPLVWFAFKKRKHLPQAIFFTVLIVLLVSGSVLLIPYTTVSMPIPGIVTPKMTPEETTKILHSLLKNIYRSFDFREEEDVYDKLSVCVEGEILTDIYLQNRKSFEVKQAGGARAKVNQVEIHEVETLTNKGYFEKQLQVHTKWSAQGSVGHWGHIHTRKNMYDALITLEPIDRAWKIINLELLEEKRVDPNA